MTATAIRTDEQIQADVLDELRWDARVQPNEVGVSVKEGVVSLTGWVDSFVKKWAAERSAQRVRGVRAVANDVEVRLPAAADRTDGDIAAAATRALEWDALVPVERIAVTVAQGWVSLRGEVEWEFQRRAAERSSRRLAGVRGVSNQVTVRPRSRPAPDELRRRIENALVRSAETDATGLTVEVAGDRIILRGTVRSWAERREAERVAWSAPGVTSVENRVVVAP
ncbi:BON domain-containing protein [Rhizomonospora bruguierae]|uniref:BON domain-containing protein n=1 Tax=Rhizomonospora bruguierae TaxID=1581705 RepID=UPI001BCD1D7B|nr:BON domain-containing protein [Micromonospora sp. NBRC 107566]